MKPESVLFYAMIFVVITTIFGCSTTSPYKQVADEVPHYGLSEVKTSTGFCYVYVERNNGTSLSCVRTK